MSNDTDEPRYTVDLNGKRYELNKDARQSIQTRAEYEYEENERFSCWWKVASPSQYGDDEWDENIHDAGDPVLVIETQGYMVPWERLDKLNVEMQDADPFGGMDSGGQNADTVDSGGGMQSIDPNSSGDDTEKVIGRTHFEQDPREYEGVESPDGEEEDKIPPAPREMPDHPMLVKWVPDHPDIEHTWSAGEALTPTVSWVEWNVQKYADQPRISEESHHSHDHWESLLQADGCDVVAELSTNQDVPSNSDNSSDNEPEDIGPKVDNARWQV